MAQKRTKGLFERLVNPCVFRLQKMRTEYSEQAPTDFNLEKFPKGSDVSYEFELRVRLPDWIADLRPADAQKGKSLPKDPKADDTSHLSATEKAVKKFANATAKLPGHVFFVVRAKENGKTVTENEIGFTYAREANLKTAKKKPGMGVPGYVQDQKKKDPRYDFSKTFSVSRDGLESLGKFLEDSTKNPPNYTWPIAWNCVRFAKKAAKEAGIKNTKLMGLTNLPMGTVAYIKARQAAEEMEKAASRIGTLFSKDRNVPHAEKQKTNDAVQQTVLSNATKGR